MNLSLHLQGQITVPATPEMIRVSVKGDSAIVEWKRSTTQSIDGYIILKFDTLAGRLAYDVTKGIRIHSADSLKRTIYFPEVKLHPVKFAVIAFKDPDTLGNTKIFHQTIFTRLNYDSCHSQMIVTWTKYVGWGNDLLKYTVYQIKGGITTSAGETASNDTVLHVPVDPNTNYCFYVEAERADHVISRSNDTCYYTKFLTPPGFISADKTWFNENTTNPVFIQFTIDPASQIKKYQLFASDNPADGFTSVQSSYDFTLNPTILSDTLKNLLPRYYRLDAINGCNQSTVQSNVATALVPVVAVNATTVSLKWNAYLNWPQGIANYAIYRSIGNGAFVPTLTLLGGQNFAEDNVKDLIKQQLPGKFCYYVKALSNADSNNDVDESVSATLCVDLSENVFIPDAFTPNNDGRNDEFGPFFPFLPKEYMMLIFDRYGTQIFQTTDQQKGWNGRLSSGKKASDGAYVYFIKYISQGGKAIERKGSFSLIYR
jgi:gliding motility-associated-like protein